jgi:hypothetical protein
MKNTHFQLSRLLIIWTTSKGTHSRAVLATRSRRKKYHKITLKSNSLSLLTVSSTQFWAKTMKVWSTLILGYFDPVLGVVLLTKYEALIKWK